VQAKASAAKILALEIKMSNPRLDRVERRDGRLQYNPMTIAELQKMTPAINGRLYFAGIGFTKLDTVIVSQPKYMKALQTILSENNVSAWKEYMKWTLLNGLVCCLVQSMQLILILWKDINRTIKQRPLETELCKQLMAPSVKRWVNYMLKKCFLLRQKQKRKR
jgi:endothelin-converting enzyme/putative endopeptidase